MKIATFERDGIESWGLVMTSEMDGEEWVYEPEKCEQAFRRVANGTSGYFRCLPEFMPNRKWPQTLREFLELGDEGMTRLKKFETFLKHYMKQSDSYYISCCCHPLSQVRLRTPVPQASLFLGLVQNSSSFWRARPERIHANLIPQAHQRSMTSVLGCGELFLGDPGGNVELGVVIGKECYNVPIEDVYDYIAGYTVVFDSQIEGYYEDFDPGIGFNQEELSKAYPDWFVDATCSWLGKGGDSRCICGPYLTTKDEVGNPYDLLVWTKTNRKVRDRSNTSGYVLGVERTVHFFAQFMRLHPGDMIHMGTVGTDGVDVDTEVIPFEEYGSVGAEIEYCGEIWGYVHWPQKLGEHRTPAQKEIPLVPGVQDYINKKGREIDNFTIAEINDVWTCYGNFKACGKELGWNPAPSPRMLNGPRGQVTDFQGNLFLSPIAGDLELSAEVAVVIKKVCKLVSAADAENYILGYATILSVYDSSMFNQIIQPATGQEQGSAMIYGRWGDGYATIGEVQESRGVSGRKISLAAEGLGTARGNTDEYLHGAARCLEYLSAHTTVLPGDVILLGRVGSMIKVPKEAYQNGLHVRAEIEGLGVVERTLWPFRKQS